MELLQLFQVPLFLETSFWLWFFKGFGCASVVRAWLVHVLFFILIFICFFVFILIIVIFLKCIFVFLTIFDISVCYVSDFVNFNNIYWDSKGNVGNTRLFAWKSYLFFLLWCVGLGSDSEGYLRGGVVGETCGRGRFGNVESPWRKPCVKIYN